MCRFVCALTLLIVVPVAAHAEHPIRFDIQTLTVDANEGCAIADFDGDGKLDVSAGRNWYHNGDWLPRPVRNIEDKNGYVTSNGDFALDVDQDGDMDIVAGQYFVGEVHWYENTGAEKLLQGYMWPPHLIKDTGQTTNEIVMLHDIDDDNVPEWVVNQWNAEAPLMFWKMVPGRGESTVKQEKKTANKVEQVMSLTPTEVGPVNGHGIAFGDINNDGREDIIVGKGWYERPSSDPLKGDWTYHADWDLHMSCPAYVRDLDGDGTNDLIWGKAHDFGLFIWWGRGADDEGKLKFEEEVVDATFSQLHCLHFADLDGDGQDELITGKRVRAHNGNDPGGTEPPQLVYYTWDKSAKKFTQHLIDRGQVGIGLQIRTADLDGDGDTDIVVPGKEGTQILWSQLK